MSDQVEPQPQQGGRGRLYLVALIPLIIAVIIGGFLYRGLDLDPKLIPSVLINKPAPEFNLAALPGYEKGLATGDLKGQKLVLVNVFASWCVACRVEHPLLMDLKRKGLVDIYGLNYKDEPGDAVQWLNRFGDPYTQIGSDRDGRVGIDFGVYGVPETFLVNEKGVIIEKITGPISQPILQEKLMPMIQEARK